MICVGRGRAGFECMGNDFHTQSTIDADRALFRAFTEYEIMRQRRG